MLCMKTKGQIVREWRERMKWTTTQLAREVGTSRQNIENLEADNVDQPRYLSALAKVMGYLSTDDLLALHAPPEPPGVRPSPAGIGRALQMMLDAGKPLAAVERLSAWMQPHSQTRREIIGDLLQKLARDPGNQELIEEIAAQLDRPPTSESKAA